MASQTLKSVDTFPGVYFSIQVDFDTATVFSVSAEHHFLVVMGNQPFLNMKLSLLPQPDDHDPDYWQIYVTGVVGPPTVGAGTPFTIVEDVGPFCGAKGIEVIGAQKRQKIKISKGAGLDVIKP